MNDNNFGQLPFTRKVSQSDRSIEDVGEIDHGFPRALFNNFGSNLVQVWILARFEFAEDCFDDFLRCDWLDRWSSCLSDF